MRCGRLPDLACAAIPHLGGADLELRNEPVDARDLTERVQCCRDVDLHDRLEAVGPGHSRAPLAAISPGLVDVAGTTWSSPGRSWARRSVSSAFKHPTRSKRVLGFDRRDARRQSGLDLGDLLLARSPPRPGRSWRRTPRRTKQRPLSEPPGPSPRHRFPQPFERPHLARGAVSPRLRDPIARIRVASARPRGARATDRSSASLRNWMKFDSNREGVESP